jgi:Ca-activated chloride channel family protein
MLHRIQCTLFALSLGLAPAGLAVAAPRAQVTIKAHPGKPVFQSEQAKPQPPEITVDPQTHTVTVRVSVEDPDGYFIPNLRPQNFAVYEDGVQQKDVAVDVEHAAVSLSVLVEGGGRYQQLNKILSTEIPYVGHPLLDALVPADRVGVFAYTSAVQTLADFNELRSAVEAAFTRVPAPGFSEANLYDAIVDVLNRTPPPAGRKAMLVISTGLDTFSHASFEDVATGAARAGTPVYAIGLGGLVQRNLIDPAGPLAKIDWQRASEQLKTLAKASGGRTYLREIALDVPAIYDDMMEHLRVRYVLKYVSSNPAAGAGHARTVRVALVDPKAGSKSGAKGEAPLRIVDASGKAITARADLQGSYTP